MSMQDWVVQYTEQEKLRQQEIDNNPNSKSLYTYEIDVDTLEIESSEIKVLDYDEECTGYASYEESSDGSRVYAESLVSPADARQLVLDFCEKFAICCSVIEKEILTEQRKNWNKFDD